MAVSKPKKIIRQINSRVSDGPIPIPISNPVTPDRFGIRRMSLVTVVETDTNLNGEVINPKGVVCEPGTVYVTIDPGSWSGDTWVPTILPRITINDAVAWLTALAVDGDPQAAEASMRFSRIKDDLLWLERKLLSQQGEAPAPE